MASAWDLARSATSFLRDIYLAKSPNQVNKLFLELERNSSPSEVRALLRLAWAGKVAGFDSRLVGYLSWLIRATQHQANYFPGASRLESVAQAHRRLLKLRRAMGHAPETSEAHKQTLNLAPGVNLFRSATARDKLLVLFTPRGGHMGVILPRLIEIAGSAHYDVLAVIAPQNEQWPWTEVRGVLGGFSGFIDAVSVEIDRFGYKSVHTLGYSFGAPLSFLTGIALQADSITPIGLTVDLFQPGSAYEEFCSQEVRFQTFEPQLVGNRVKFVVGELCEEDLQVARSMSRRLPGAMTVIVEDGSHDALSPIINSGALKQFLLAVGSTRESLISNDQLRSDLTLIT